MLTGEGGRLCAWLKAVALLLSRPHVSLNSNFLAHVYGGGSSLEEEASLEDSPLDYNK